MAGGALAAVTLFTDTGGHKHEQAIRAANAKGLFAGKPPDLPPMRHPVTGKQITPDLFDAASAPGV